MKSKKDHRFIFEASCPGPLTRADCIGGPLHKKMIAVQDTVTRFMYHPIRNEDTLPGLGVITNVYKLYHKFGDLLTFRYDKEDIIYRTIDAIQTSENEIVTPDELCHCPRCQQFRARIFVMMGIFMN